MTNWSRAAGKISTGLLSGYLTKQERDRLLAREAALEAARQEQLERDRKRWEWEQEQHAKPQPGSAAGGNPGYPPPLFPTSPSDGLPGLNIYGRQLPGLPTSFTPPRAAPMQTGRGSIPQDGSAPGNMFWEERLPDILTKPPQPGGSSQSFWPMLLQLLQLVALYKRR
ncbi:MAG: hypothetical protein ACYDBB_24685 [Armatimonadota bacterium]